MMAVPQSGPMTQKPELTPLLLQSDLRFDRHIVAEDHDVQAAVQRLSRLRRRIVAGHRNQSEIGIRQHLQPGAKRLRSPALNGIGLSCRLLQKRFRRGERPIGALGIDGANPDDQITRRCGAASVIQKLGIGHDLAIGGRAHHQGRFFDSVQRDKILGAAHQSDAIHVEG